MPGTTWRFPIAVGTRWPGGAFAASNPSEPAIDLRNIQFGVATASEDLNEGILGLSFGNVSAQRDLSYSNFVDELKPLEKWLKEGKLGCSEQLGDLVRLHDVALAQQIYQEAGASQKVIAAMAESGNFDQILPYSRSVGYSPDFNALLQHITRVSPEKGAEFPTVLPVG